MRSVRSFLTSLVLSCFVVACDAGSGGDDLSSRLPDAGTPATASGGISGGIQTAAGGAANVGPGGIGGSILEPAVPAGPGGSAAGSSGSAPVASGGVGGMAVIGSGGMGVMPMPEPPAPALGYGEECTRGAMCEGGICLTGHGCSRLCDINAPNPCRAEKGFCMPISEDRHACGGQIDTGRDDDDAIVKVGDSVRRSVSRLDDLDLFTAKLDRLGVVILRAQPEAGVDVVLDIYNAIGEKIGSFNTAGLGGAEAAQTEVEEISGWLLVVVRNVGHTTGAYEFAVERAQQ